MKAKNQLVVISGILVLLATATIAASYNVQPVNAKSTGDSNFGQLQASPQARDGVGNANNPANGNGLGATTSGLAGPGFGGIVSCYAKNAGNPC
jgi:hypothetical protein